VIHKLPFIKVSNLKLKMTLGFILNSNETNQIYLLYSTPT